MHGSWQITTEETGARYDLLAFKEDTSNSGQPDDQGYANEEE